MILSTGVTEVRSHTRSRFAAGASMVLVFVLVLCTSACGGTKPTKAEQVERYGQELRERIAATVTDPRRRDEALQVVDQMQALQQRFNRETSAFVDNYRKLNADYETTRPTLDQLFADYSNRRVAARNEALELHFRLAALSTATEWDAIGKAEAKLYKKVSAAPLPQEHST